MKIETKEIYKCDFCNKLYQLKRFAEKHERQCSRNPENNRPCFTCQFLEKKNTTMYLDHYLGYDIERTVGVLFCSSKKAFLYPPKVQIKNNQFDLGDDSNEPMPKECKEYNLYGYRQDNL